MIPTRYKSKLSRSLSYPLGAEAISSALAGAPHYSDLTLSFHDSPVWRGSDFRRLLRESIPYAVFVASYSPARSPGYTGSATMAEMGMYAESWDLRVNPVRRELRHTSGQLLQEQGLPAVVQWLQLSNEAGWDAQYHSLTLVFDPAEETLSARRWDGM